MRWKTASHFCYQMRCFFIISFWFCSDSWDKIRILISTDSLLLNILQIMSFISLLHRQHSISICSVIKQSVLNKSIDYRSLRSIYFIANIKETLTVCKLSFIFDNIMFIIKQLRITNFLLSVLTTCFALI